MSSNATSTSRRRISSVALAHAFDSDAVCIIDHDTYFYITRGLGPTYTFSTRFVVGQPFPTKLDCGSVLSRTVTDPKHSPRPSLPSTDSTTALMNKQAEMFLHMIAEVASQSTDDPTATAILPSVHALQHCIKSGWQPESIPQGVLDATLRLCTAAEREAAATASSLLDTAMNCSASIFRQVLVALLHLPVASRLEAASRTDDAPTPVEVLLDRALCRFVRSSFTSHLIFSADEAVETAREQARSSGAEGGVGRLALGDSLEILMANVWVTGTIVRSNALTGELHIEHVKSTAPGAPAGTMVTVLPKNSPRLRLSTSSGAAGRLSSPSSGDTPPGLASQQAEDAVARKWLVALESMAFGLPPSSLPAVPTEAPRPGRSSGGLEIPLCQNGHTCTVVLVPPTSAGFMCAYCSRLHPSSPGAGDNHPGRAEGTMFKWTCAACQYDVCLTCFPNPAYPKGGHSPTAATRAANATQVPAPAGLDPSISGQGTVGTRCTICMVGSELVTYCKVRAEPSVTAAEVARVSRGSVIDVLDLPNSDFFQLLTAPGYVKKQPGALAHWKRVARDRYAVVYEEDAVSIFSGEVELSRSNQGSASAPDAARQDASVGAMGVIELLLDYDAALKTTFAQFLEAKGPTKAEGGRDQVQGALVAVLRSVRELFAKTLVPLGELVTADSDSFDDPVDDYFIASERVPIPLAATGARAVAGAMAADAADAPAPGGAGAGAGAPAGDAVAKSDGSTRSVAGLGVTLLPAAAQRSAKELLSTLAQPGLALRERVAALVVTNAFALVAQVLTRLAERRITDPDAPPNDTEQLALDVVSTVANSTQHAILRAFFYRVMIVRAAIRAKLAVALFFNRNHNLADSVQPAMDTFVVLESIERAYSSVMVAAATGSSAYLVAGLTEKLRSTMAVVGFAGLANGIIEHHRRGGGTGPAGDNSQPTGIKEALRRHILQPADRFAPASRGMRRFLKVLCQYASEEGVSLLEGLWREVISDLIVERCSRGPTEVVSGTPSRAVPSTPARFQAEARSEGLVDFLITTLSEMRYISKLDMAVTKQCYMSADAAFVTAFRRLPKEVSLELTKALVVRVSSLIDSYKTLSMSRAWAQALDGITDLIQVLFTQSSAEFLHFYELLLSRRLLRNRYISLSTEWRVLGLLPALSKSSLMIRDVEQTEASMHVFRNYLVDQIDFKDLTMDRATTELALSAGRLKVHVLTGDVWPTLWLRPLSYAQLRLPRGMEQLKQQFRRFFDAQDTTRYESLKQLEAYRPIQVSGSEENAARVNGIYEPTLETVDGWPVYEMRGSDSPSIIEYSAKTGSWHIKKRSERGRNAGVAYCRSPAHVPLDQLDKPWYVWKRAARKWMPQPVRIVTLPATSGDPLTGSNGVNLSVNDASKRSRSLRRLVWCAAAGTVQLQANLAGGSKCYLTVTEPQAALLLAFCDPEKASYSAGELQTLLNLPKEELTALLGTLSSARYPVLEAVGQSSSEYRLSKTFLAGQLGGTDEDCPIVLSSLELDVHHDDAQIFDADLHSLHGWRNELVDACIVRTLKHAAAHKTGEFSNQFRQRCTALPIDTLTFQVRRALKDQCDVSEEDIIRRSERLVTEGIVDKVVGNSDTFRSVAYCYLSQAVTGADEVEDDTLVRGGFTCEKLYGHDLYNHLRIVLGIKTLPIQAPGIPLSLFKHKFLTWIVSAQCEIDAGPDGRRITFLDLVPGLLIELCSAAVLQANALKVQFWHGIQSLCNSRCPPGTFYQLPGIDSLQVMCNVLRTSMSNDLPNVHNYLCLDRIYVEHFPARLLQGILNFFRRCLREPLVDYRHPARFAGSRTDSKLGTGTHSYGRYGASAPSVDWEEGDEQFAVANGGDLRQELLALWHRTAIVRKEDLVVSLGIPASSLDGLGVVSSDPDRPPSPELKGRHAGSAYEIARPATARSRFGQLSGLAPKSPKNGALQQEYVQISLQQLMAAVIQRAAMFIDAENAPAWSGETSLTFAQLLDELYFRKMVDTVAEVFDIKLTFAEDIDAEEQNNSQSQGSGPGQGQGEGIAEMAPREEEVYIPCEFCTESIRMSLFAAHTQSCPANPNRVRHVDPLANHQAPGQREEVLKPPAENNGPVVPQLESRPDTLSPTGLAFVESLLNAIVTAAADLQMPSNEYYPSLACGTQRANFTYYLEHVFRQLDRDHDGFITGADFAVTERSYADLRPSVDPVLLYGRRCSLFDDAPLGLKSHIAITPPAIGFADVSDDEGDDLLELSTPIAMNKVSSLWRSVSHGRSLPVADPSRSYAGLEEAEQELRAVVKRVTSIIDESESTTLTLLLHYKWDVKKLVEDVIDNSRAVRLAAGLGPRSMPPFLRHDLAQTQGDASAGSRAGTPAVGGMRRVISFEAVGNALTEDGLVVCGICQDTVPPSEAFALHCRHWHCEGCWQGFIHTAINDRSVVYRCPQPNCKFVVTQDMQSFFADDAHIRDAKSALIKSFVEDRRGRQVLATYCKNPRGCDGIVLLADDADHSEASCSLCGTTFCAACDMPPHAPATCAMVAKWEEKGGYIETGRAEDAEARKLKHLTTKPCPKCGVRIEKSGGCPHMTCVQPSCKYQFCWECAGEYHTSTTCTRPKVKPEANSILAFDELDRHCANHFLARKVALKGRSHCHKQLEQAQRPEDAAELRVMAEGWSVLADAQAALAHTCIVMLNAKSAKLSFLFECMKQQAQALQQKYEEVWTTMETFPMVEAKATIRDLRVRHRDYLLAMQAEIITERAPKSPPRRKSTPARAAASPSVGRSPGRAMASSAASPAIRKSAVTTPGSLTRGLSAEATMEDLVQGEDRLLFDILVHHQQQLNPNDELPGEPLSRAMMVDVATTVFGDGLGGSWRHYSAYVAPPMVSGMKGSPPSQLKLAIATSSGSRNVPTPPVRALGRTIPLTFTTPGAASASSSGPGFPDFPAWAFNPPGGASLTPGVGAAGAGTGAVGPEGEEQEDQGDDADPTAPQPGFVWPPGSDQIPDAKRARK